MILTYILFKSLCSFSFRIQLSQVAEILNYTECENKSRPQKLAEAIKGWDEWSPEDQKIIFQILEDFPQVFSLEGEPPGDCPIMPLSLDTIDEVPVFRKQYKIPQCYQKDVDECVDSMLEHGIISPTDSPYKKARN